MKLIAIAIAAALAAGCTVHNDERGLLVASKLIQATPPTGTATSGCAYLPATNEAVFGSFDPAAGYVHAVVIQNLLPNNGVGPGRLNTNDFQVEGATITTDVLVGPAQSIATQTVPANGFIVAAGGISPIAVALAQPGAIQGGSDVRFHIQIFGVLMDGSKVKANTYEYAAHAIAGFQLSAAGVCATGKTPFFCEGQSQDTGIGCL
jgi:hypothetical protein